MGPNDDPISRSVGASTPALALADEAAHGLARRMPLLSARKVITGKQASVLIALAVGLIAFAMTTPSGAWDALVGLTWFSFLAGTLFRAALFLIGGAPPLVEMAEHTAELPIYTILVPLYREANVLPRLARALLLLDYPRDRLDIKLVVEEADHETLAVAKLLAGRGPFEIVCVPEGSPKTKPRACNFALNFARGEFTVIFDAEDRPDRDQLKKAVAAFRTRSEDIACLQARLGFYNADDCWLTRGIRAQMPPLANLG